MAKSKFSLVRGGSLLAILSATTLPVKWISGRPPFPSLPPECALLIAKAGVYEGKVKHGRVYQIREILCKEDPPDFSFWRDRGCIRFHDNDGPNSPLPQEKQRRRVAIWDRVLKDPPPRWKPRGTV